MEAVNFEGPNRRSRTLVDAYNVVVRLERIGCEPTVQAGLSTEHAASVLVNLRGQPDVTATIRREGRNECLMVAISGEHAFVGLESPDGLSQLTTGSVVSPSGRFLIGGQATLIEGRYVLDVPTAAGVVLDWLNGQKSLVGSWERR